MAIDRLKEAYHSGDPAACLLAHLLHAGELEQAGEDTESVLHHRLAAGLIALRAERDRVEAVVAEIRATSRPEQAPTFDQVADTVERTTGVAFRALLERLPGGVRSEEQMLDALWTRVSAGPVPMVHADAPNQRVVSEEFWQSLPPSVRRALSLEGEALDEALKQALGALPTEEARRVVARLHDAGILGSVPEEGPDHLVEGFRVFLTGVVAVALGDDAPRPEIEFLLPELERAGWHITVPVYQIWEGRRDEAGLCAGLDPASARLVKQILVMLREAETTGQPPQTPEAPPPRDVDSPVLDPLNPREVSTAPPRRLVDISNPESLTAEQLEVLDGMPPLLRDVFTLEGSDFGVVLNVALAAMPPGEALSWMERLLRAGMIGEGEEVTAEDALEHMDPFLFDIAQVAMGREDLRPKLESYLHALEGVGLQITDAVLRMWAGERDPTSLIAGLSPANALVVQRILEHLNREIV